MIKIVHELFLFVKRNYRQSVGNVLEMNEINIMLLFNFILGLILIFSCFKIIIIHYHTQRQRKLKIKPIKKLNDNIITYHCLTGFIMSLVFNRGARNKSCINPRSFDKY